MRIYISPHYRKCKNFLEVSQTVYLWVFDGYENFFDLKNAC